MSATASPSPFTAQARSAGLSLTQTAELQRHVDEVVARTAGTQVAANKVVWRNAAGATTLPLPGELRARDLGQSPILVAGFPYGCPFRALCTYAGADFTGQRHDLWSCIDHSTPWPFGSYSNNQTRGTVARFKDSNKTVIHTSAGAPSAAVFSGANTWFIKPC